MKYSVMIALLILSAVNLSACSPSGVNSSTVGVETRQTSRTPSPGNVQGTNLMNSTRMVAPTAQ